MGGMFLSSCSSEEVISNKGNIKRIEASISNFQMEDGEPQTRTSYTFGASGYEAVWATGDVLGIYPLGGDQVAFPISDGVGTTRAVFDGGAWALRGTYKYAAYYPFSQDNYTISETEIPVTYIGQIQNSNNATTHLAKYDYMAAAATQPSSDGSVILPFKHLGSYLTLPLTLPKAGTYTKLTLSSSSGSFITKGTVDLSASNPVITATETSSSISIDLNNIVLTEGNLVLTANMLIAPVDLTGSTITITVTDSNGAIYTNKEKAWTRTAAFLANTTYKASRVLSGSGTGGEIEGGGGLEEDDDTPNMHNGHEYVDLGVVVDGKPVYWATTNIGAEQPADYGLYFAWGETFGYTEDANDGRKFDWASYSSKLCGGGSYNMKKYCTDGNGIVDYKTVLDPEDDAAHVNWQGAWRMPTKEEQDAIRSQCTWTWTTMTNSLGKSVNGCKVSNKTDSSKYIFLPAAGNRLIGVLYAAGSGGDYWSSSLSTRESYSAFFIHFDSDNYGWGNGNRYYGHSVRPVCQ